MKKYHYSSLQRFSCRPSYLTEINLENAIEAVVALLVKLCVVSVSQMFIFDDISGNKVSTHQFEVTGSTYAPEGDM